MAFESCSSKPTDSKSSFLFFNRPTASFLFCFFCSILCLALLIFASISINLYYSCCYVSRLFFSLYIFNLSVWFSLLVLVLFIPLSLLCLSNLWDSAASTLDLVLSEAFFKVLDLERGLSLN